MKTTVKNLSDTKVQLTITLGVEELEAAKQVAVKHISHDLKVAGFRKGKVPYDVALKNINPDDLQEQIGNEAISKAVAEAFIENKLQALGRPAVELKKFVPNETLEFTAEAEIMPTVKLGNYKKLNTKTEKVEVKETEIDEIVDRVRQGYAEKKDVERSAKDGDETIIDFVGKKDGVAFEGGTGKDYNLTLGSHQFISGFEEGIVGHKKGDVFDLDLTFPEDYGAKDLQGAKVVFTVTLNAIKEVILPELDDKLAAKVGPFKTAAELRDDIKREITAQKEREASEKLKDNLVMQLVEASVVPVPEILVSDQMQSIEQDFANNLMYQGLSLDQYLENKGFEAKEKWLAEEVKPIAEKRVKAGLVLAELSKAESIEATPAELEERIEMFRQQYAKNPETLKQFENPEVRRDIANRLLTEKTVDRLVKINSK